MASGGAFDVTTPAFARKRIELQLPPYCTLYGLNLKPYERQLQLYKELRNPFMLDVKVNQMASVLLFKRGP